MVADDIATMLIAVESLAPSGSLFIDFLPDQPDAAMALYPTGASFFDGVMDLPGPRYERPRVQVVARAATHSACTTKIQAAYDALRVVRNRYVSGIFYLSVWPIQSPFFLGRDDNQRWMYVFNVEALRAI